MTKNLKEFETIGDVLSGASRIAIAGHVSPDGDCVGSTLALYLYLKKEQTGEVRLYLEETKPCFSFLPGLSEARNDTEGDPVPDLLILLDVSSVVRIGAAGSFYEKAERVVCIDHHISNPGIGHKNVIFPDASSASEVLYTLLDRTKIDRDIASCLYTGIVHDTGIFQYSCTSPETMRIAADLLAMDIPFSYIIEHTFLNRTMKEQLLLGHVLEAAELVLDGKCVISSIRQETLDRYGAGKLELDSCVAQLRKTEGPECAVFLYPAEEGSYKVSLRSVSSLDVSAIAVKLGGGGHTHAAGCTVNGMLEEVRAMVLALIEEALSRL